jgi:hypothetical protein
VDRCATKFNGRRHPTRWVWCGQTALQWWVSLSFVFLELLSFSLYNYLFWPCYQFRYPGRPLVLRPCNVSDDSSSTPPSSSVALYISRLSASISSLLLLLFAANFASFSLLRPTPQLFFFYKNSKLKNPSRSSCLILLPLVQPPLLLLYAQFPSIPCTCLWCWF